MKETSFANDVDAGPRLFTATHSGRSGDPDLICRIRLHSRPAFAEIEVQVRNSTAAPTTVQSIRVLEAVDPFVNLDGPPSSDRVLSDSSARPAEHGSSRSRADQRRPAIWPWAANLSTTGRAARACFSGALTSERWLTILHLHVDDKLGGLRATRSIPQEPPNWPNRIR